MAVTKRLGRGLLTALAEGTRLSRLLFETLQPIDNCSVEFNCPSAGFLTNSSFFLFLLSLLIFFLNFGVNFRLFGIFWFRFISHSFFSVCLSYLFEFFSFPLSTNCRHCSILSVYLVVPSATAISRPIESKAK